jgi:RND family efflux transporter MFP subunit
MFRKKGFWIALILVALAAGGGYAAYAHWFAPAETPEQGSTMETATVTVGDLSITADGTGVLVAASQVNLSFGSSGSLSELVVQVGDRVQAGDVLGRIDDTDARMTVAEAELAVLQAKTALEEARDAATREQAVAQAEFQITQTVANLEAARSDLDDLVNWAPDETEVEVAQANLAIAQASYQNTVAKANMYDEGLASTRINLDNAIGDLNDAQLSYANAMDAARDWEKNIESTRERAAESLRKAQDNLEIAQASYDLNTIDTRSIDLENARVKVLNAEETLAGLQEPPKSTDITAARVKVQELEVALQQARLDLADAEKALAEADTSEEELNLEQAQLRLESAQEALQGATLVAPITGTVTEVNAEVGEKVSGTDSGNGTTVVVLANLDQPVVQFWIEESELSNVAVGHPVRIVFEALPDLTYEGEITRIDPVLVTVGNTTALQVWASIDTAAHPVALLGDMNVEVEVVAGEALNVPLVPVQALRELGEDQYAVFVVKDNGELEMRVIEVGLKDYVNAEVVSGLQRGEVVSLGEKTTSSSQPSTNNTQNQGPPGGPGMGFFGG